MVMILSKYLQSPLYFCEDSGAGSSLDEDEAAKNCRRFQMKIIKINQHYEVKRFVLSECYFAGKGAALVLPPNERAPHTPDSRRPSGSDIQQHLQSMFYLLRPQETLKMAVKLESVHSSRTRYLVVVSCLGRQQSEESCLLGIDCNSRTTVGLVLRVMADTAITLDGDGGFSVSVCGRQHIFKPVSVQAMWSALQTLHKVSSKAREKNYFLGGLTHDWVSYYEQRIESDRSCLNEWHAMDNLESRRPPSPDSLRTKPREREETEKVIRSALKEIMMTVDLDEVTSKQVRTRLEEFLDMDLGEYKPFIDQEMLVILGQMDAATEIFPHVYLGSEWNASNLEELNKNGVCHILNVTREIDNFFPGMFDYLNVRVYDDEKTDLLKHWDNTFKYITKAKDEGSKVLVHCKMGVSRSASVVIAYAMKAYNWDLKKALEYVQKKRNCIKPNSSFISQLETYQGILDAMKNKEKLQRSKSETNLKTNGREAVNNTCINGNVSSDGSVGVGRSVSEGEGDGHVKHLESELSSRVRCRRQVNEDVCDSLLPGDEMSRLGVGRPKSWSPDHTTANTLFPVSPVSGPTSASMERLTVDQQPRDAHNYNINVRMPCGNGLAYSVSQNKILHLPCEQSASVKTRVSALESANAAESQLPNTPSLGRKDRKGLVLNLTSQFEESPPTSLVKKEEPWDPGETNWEVVRPVCDLKTISRKVRVEGDLFSNKLDRVFDREERKQQRNVPCVVTEEDVRSEISRQSSWSSYDSAVILKDCISRQSSWGSADTRTCTLPSRNSSWGSYDLRPSQQQPQLQTQQHELYVIGTVKRTKQKLEEGSDTVKRVCPDNNSRISDELRNTTTKDQTNLLEVKNYVCNKEVSPTANTTGGIARRCISVDESKLLNNQAETTTVSAIENQKNISGIVKNLKKEFEAKSVGIINNRNDRFTSDNSDFMKHEESNARIRSLPSSPVSEKSEKPSPAVSLEDLSVRKLVGRYEDRPKLSSESEKRLMQPPIPPRKSSLDVQQSSAPPVTCNNQLTTQVLHHHQPQPPFVLKTSLFHNLKNNRPPTVKAVPPTSSVVVASVVAKAASKKQQQGKTHPLARLTINKQRHNNPVYNTM
ncbi:protein phosphatase Slingshot isoform X3 [Lycorma delicatula]|uniref:protein phosphatase Slingshot isoform X3 n=1 Tax=Lycorma delicatula TaxID=130591 RepID=UPI003F514A68